MADSDPQSNPELLNLLVTGPKAFAHAQRADLAAAKTIAVPPGAASVLLQAAGQAVRFTLDTTAPTAVRGIRIAAGASMTVPCFGATSIIVIEEAATATLDHQFFG